MQNYVYDSLVHQVSSPCLDCFADSDLSFSFFSVKYVNAFRQLPLGFNCEPVPAKLYPFFGSLNGN